MVRRRQVHKRLVEQLRSMLKVKMRFKRWPVAKAMVDRQFAMRKGKKKMERHGILDSEVEKDGMRG
jgi:hypothetical protein